MQRGSHAVIPIASVLCQCGNAGPAACAASESVVIALTQVMATELAPPREAAYVTPNVRNAAGGLQASGVQAERAQP